ncbi:MAG: helix-turn-helix transcriptional regulator [Elusimicrobia bacterium]|nr:helix-turn-helix transcriptional regulator [Elusimicrobiota bacterium]
MIPKKTFSVDQLKKYMIEKGISQQDLAKKIGVIQQQISFWITGRHAPTLASIKKIADALRIPYENFLEAPKNSSDLDEKDIKILKLEKEILELKLKLKEKKKN